MFSTSWNNSWKPYYTIRFNMMAFFSLYPWKIMGCLFCMFAHSNVQYFVLSNVVTCFVLCCDVRYDFRIKTMFGLSLPPVVHMRAHVLCTLFVFVCASWYPTHIVLCFCVYLSSSCVLCTQCCQFLWIVHSWLSLRFPLTFIDSW